MAEFGGCSLSIAPGVVFIKGGYVGVPVGLCAWILRIPYVTHDSDALAGLSNRLIGRGASLHAVGMAPEAYAYPAHKTVFTGIPVGEDFCPVSPDDARQAKIKLGIPATASVLMITGGSNGAQRLNTAMQPVVRELLEMYKDLWVIHQLGAGAGYDQISGRTIGRERTQERFCHDARSERSGIIIIEPFIAGA